MSYETLRLKNQLCHPLYTAAHAMQRAYKPLLDRLQITYPQYLILMVLWEKDEINIKEISEQTLFDSGSLTPLLQKLKTQGLIVVKTLPQDRRNKIIGLTAKGKKLQDKALEVPKEIMCKVALTPDEFHSLKKLTETLIARLQESEKK